MELRKGKIIAELADQADPNIAAGLIEIINRKVDPPQMLGPDDIYVRAMYIVSDQINSFGGRFELEEMQLLADLLIDSPVLIGHRKDRLPIGRTFHAVMEQRENVPWVKSYFYWLKKTDGAETLRENIDGGIYKECSIGFTFYTAECSICGDDIRTCRHEPFKFYGENQAAKRCFFYYRQIEKVLETSLVYRGAVANTSITDKLFSDGSHHWSNAFAQFSSTDQLPHLTSLESLPLDSELLVWPHYSGKIVKLGNSAGRLALQAADSGAEINLQLPEQLNQLGLPDETYAVLIGKRGKQRLSVSELNRYLSGKRSSVSSLELRLLCESSPLGVSCFRQGNLIARTAPLHRVNVGEITQIASSLATLGGMILALELKSSAEIYRYIPNYRSHEIGEVVCGSYDDCQFLRIKLNRNEIIFRPAIPIPTDPAKGVSIVIEQCESIPKFSSEPLWRAGIYSASRVGQTLDLSGNGNLAGGLRIKPLVQQGRRSFVLMFGAAPAHATKGLRP